MSEIAIWCLSERGLRLVSALSESLSIHCFLPEGTKHTAGFPITTFHRLESAVAKVFRAYPAHIFIMAAGIVVRILAPLLESKLKDPAVIVMDEGGQHVISLLSGHLGGANFLTQTVADLTGADPVITTATDVGGITSFDTLARQIGAKVEPKAAIKTTATALLNRQPVALVCNRKLYTAIQPDFPTAVYLEDTDPEALRNFEAVCIVSETLLALPDVLKRKTLVIRPPTLCLGIGCNRDTPKEEIATAVDKTLRNFGLSPLSVFCVASADRKADETGLKSFARELRLPFVTYPAEALNAVSETHAGLSPPSQQAMHHLGVKGVAEPAALLGAGEESLLLVRKQKIGNVTVAVARRPIPLPVREGRLTVVGIGPGHPAYMTPHARRTLRDADTVVGYTKYIPLVRSLIAGKEVIQTGMTREVERVTAALEAAAKGKRVALIGTGDAGIYGLAGLVLELAGKRGDPFPVFLSPGITAGIAAAAVVGAPLTNDYITLSLSDLLTPRETVIARMEAAAASGMVTVVYNPKSRKRTELIVRLRESFLKHRPADTPVAIVTHALREGQHHVLTTLQKFLGETITMNSLVIIGNADTVLIASPEGPRMVTRRGYERKTR